MNMLHPATLLLAWMMLALMLPWMGAVAMWIMTFLIVVMTMTYGVKPIGRMLRRVSILLLMLLLVYALGTPGTPIWNWGKLPTWEGVHAGGLQAWRLAILVCALALMLAHLNREQLLAAIYTLLLPFKTIGMPVNRIAVRLSLVLHYVDTAPVKQSLHERLERVLQVPPSTTGTMEIDVPDMKGRDLGVLIVVCLFLAWLTW